MPVSVDAARRKAGSDSSWIMRASSGGKAAMSRQLLLPGWNFDERSAHPSQS